jgi:hypothetical protein
LISFELWYPNETKYPLEAKRRVVTLTEAKNWLQDNAIVYPKSMRGSGTGKIVRPNTTAGIVKTNKLSQYESKWLDTVM